MYILYIKLSGRIASNTIDSSNFIRIYFNIKFKHKSSSQTNKVIIELIKLVLFRVDMRWYKLNSNNTSRQKKSQ